jgi:hypothetical protein
MNNFDYLKSFNYYKINFFNSNINLYDCLIHNESQDIIGLLYEFHIMWENCF